jgi:transglutaminase-like putative cysteine protease
MRFQCWVRLKESAHSVAFRSAKGRSFAERKTTIRQTDPLPRFLTLTLVLFCFVAVSGCGSSTNPAGSSTKPALPVASPPAAKAAPVNGETVDGNSTGTAAATVANITGANTIGAEATEAAAHAKARQFTFHYQFRVKDLQPTGDAEKDLVRVWLPCASSTDCQEVKRLAASAPAEISEHQETRYGNRLLYLETPIPADGGFTVDIPYEVVRHEVLKASSPADADAEKLDDALRARFLAADAMVPTTGKPLKMLETVELQEDPCDLARQLYDLVDGHVTYKKEGTGWGRGDTNWVCDSGYGNCTDFHSLFISLARSQGLPSRFEIGFSIPTDKTEGPIAGYHCWAWFYPSERGWVPVDISEADKHPELKEYYFGNLTADRVLFSLGRDLELVPKSDHEPLNFFIYPYIEVGGQILPKEKVELQFAFKDK